VNQDTNPAMVARYHEHLREKRPFERLAQAASPTRMTRELAVAGIRQRHPTASDDEVRVRLIVRLYGRDIGRRLFGDIPADAV
jgi:hypothetical protein